MTLDDAARHFNEVGVISRCVKAEASPLTKAGEMRLKSEVLEHILRALVGRLEIRLCF